MRHSIERRVLHVSNRESLRRFALETSAERIGLEQSDLVVEPEVVITPGEVCEFVAGVQIILHLSVPMTDQNHRAPIVVTHEHGLRFAAKVRSHTVLVDQPAGAGGEDSAPMPTEMLGVSLGTCIALYVHQYCAARALPHEGMRVEVEQRGARNPSRVAQFDVRVVLPEPLPPALVEILERVVHSCPVHNTLAQGATMKVSIVTPVLATV